MNNDAHQHIAALIRARAQQQYGAWAPHVPYTYGLPLPNAPVAPLPNQWWRNAKMVGSAMTLEEHHSWRPSNQKTIFLSRNLAEPVADAPLCCARAPAHRHAAPRRPRSELLTWQRLRCPKGSCIGKRGEGRW